MVKNRVFALPNVITPSRPVIFNPEVCNGCNRCVEVCPIDVYIPNHERGKPPFILHADECWYCGTVFRVSGGDRLACLFLLCIL